jgi:hypothetical protein
LPTAFVFIAAFFGGGFFFADFFLALSTATAVAGERDMILWSSGDQSRKV